MTITRYETLMLKIEELAKEPEKNAEILEKLSNKLALMKQGKLKDYHIMNLEF